MSDTATTDAAASPSVVGNTSVVAAEQSIQITVADYQAFSDYLTKFVPVLLDADYLSLQEFDKCLNEKLNVESIKKFMSDPQVRSLVIQKNLTKDEEESEQGGDDYSPVQYIISTEMLYTNPKCLR